MKFKSIIDLLKWSEGQVDKTLISNHVFKTALYNQNNLLELNRTIELLNEDIYWEIEDPISNYGFIPNDKNLVYSDKSIDLNTLKKRILVDYFDTLVKNSKNFDEQLLKFIKSKKIKNNIKLFLICRINKVSENEIFELTYNIVNYSKDEKLVKAQIWTLLNRNPSKFANYFAKFLLKVHNPYFYLGGATKNKIGKYIDENLNNKLILYLLDKISESKDLWFDIQQIGRWVGEDFVNRDNNISQNKRIELMLNKMMDYFKFKYKNSKYIYNEKLEKFKDKES